LTVRDHSGCSTMIRYGATLFKATEPEIRQVVGMNVEIDIKI